MNEENITYETETQTENVSDKKKRKEKKERKEGKALYAHPLVKVFSFLGSFAALAAVVACMVLAWHIGEDGLYKPDCTLDEAIDESFGIIAGMNVRQVIAYLKNGDAVLADEFLSERNIAALEFKSSYQKFKYSYYRYPYTKYDTPVKYTYSGTEDSVSWTIYLLPELDAHYDAYKRNYTFLSYEYQFRYFVLGGIIVGGILCIALATLFICGVGVSYKTGKPEDNFFTKFPFDILTIFDFLLGFFFFGIAQSVYDSETQAVFYILLLALCMAWFINLIHRIKINNVFRNTLCYKILSILWKLFINISLLWKTVIIMAAVSVIEFFTVVFIAVICNSAEIFVFTFLILFLEKCVAYPVILYFIYMTKTLFKAGKKLASGEVDYKVNTTGLFWDYKKHGENLNNLSGAVNKAVEERMKSEKMKTDLITNVSHDLKTPLTSVINYSDLISTEAASFDENANAAESMKKISEYSEVLNRQSNRLKRLLDDLVEISKATSGNIELNMEKLDVATILSQALGEYEERFEEKNFDTVINIPEESLYVLADPRKIWRVFDNLLHNIYKYALPGTRIFFDAKDNDGKVYMTFKNTSRDIITISPDELSERFTRNDESRHAEGNGLGLAIAKTMTEAMNGTFKIEIDGDLFKVTLVFDKESEPVTEAAETDL